MCTTVPYHSLISLYILTFLFVWIIWDLKFSTIEIVGFWCVHSSITEGTGLTEYGGTSQIVWFTALWRKSLPSSSMVVEDCRSLVDDEHAFLLKIRNHIVSHMVSHPIVPEYSRLLSSGMWHRYHHFRATCCCSIQSWTCQSKTEYSCSLFLWISWSTVTILYLEEVGSWVLWNVGTYSPNYVASSHRIWQM